MLPRRQRLSRRGFEAAVSGSRRVTSPHFSLVISESHEERGGCAVVISKKVARLSVARHLLKRRVFSILKDWCRPSRSLIVYARSGSGTLDFTALSEELQDLLRRTLPSVR